MIVKKRIQPGASVKYGFYCLFCLLVLTVFFHCTSKTDRERQAQQEQQRPLSVLPDAAKAPLEMDCIPSHVTAYQGEKVVLEFTVKNNTAASIRPELGYFMSYHIYPTHVQEKGQPGTPVPLSFDNRRFLIPTVLRRNKTVSFRVPLYFEYQEAGDYVIVFDIVKEGEYWGSLKGWQTPGVSLHLKNLFSEEFKKEYLKKFYHTGDPLLDKEQYLLRMTLKNNEIYQGRELFGFSPGSTYPAVWIRDMATYTAYAKDHYPLAVFQAGIELFLMHQQTDGQIPDWVDVAGKTGKNTVETDQESSLLLTAAEIAAGNPQWLLQSVSGKPIIDRLELALQWVRDNKRSSREGLITSGFTADWGDVENSYADERARELSDRSIPVLGIYTQAKYIQAVEKLVTLLEQTGRVTKIPPWQQLLEKLRKQTKNLLYLEDKGYFITHIVPGSERQKYFDMEKDMLAVGGNAEAISAGLMTRAEIEKFLVVLQERRRQYHLRTVSFTLIPPYPESFFPHHLMTHSWNYQNGGEWDWIGARLVKALLQSGFRDEARVYLNEIVTKNLANLSIFEWEDRQGTGRGALFYTGAAGITGEIIGQFSKN